MKYILAHDLGTSGNKATLFSDEGKMITSEVFRYDCHYFNTNWAEQDPEDFWKAICVTSRNLIDKARIDPGDIAAVSFSGQMMGCLCVDKQGNPLRPSIIWADQRAQAQAAALGEQISLRDFYHIAGHRNSASYGLQKLMWVRDNEPEVYAKTYKALNAKDFIVLRLTGKFYTEPSDATSNACIDLNTLQWSEKIVNASGIDGNKLPEIVPSTTVAGEVTPWAAGQTGLKAGTPVVMGGGDGLCSNVGAGSISPGRTFSCIGTSAWVATTSEKPLFDEEMRTFTWAHIVPGLYSPTGTMQAGGSSYNWLKGQVAKYETAVAKVQGISPYDLINAEAAKSPAGANGVLFLPYLLGERAPRWNPDATAAWLGLKMENQRCDLFRAVLEGVTLNLNIILESFRRSIPIDELLVVGGGAKGALWCPGLYSPTGTMQAGGSSYNWLKGQVAKYETAVAKVQGISPYDLINAEAAKSPAGANGVLFLPYLLGERAPRWNPDATAAWLGLKMENQRCDLFRAVLEGVTLNLNIILESFRRSIPIDELLVVGGGAKGALWCQMMADVYNARIKVPVLLEEATSMGAAVTGGVGVGVFKGFEVIDQMLELNRTVEPDPEAVAAYGPVKEAFEVCYKAMLPVYEYMASHKNA